MTFNRRSIVVIGGIAFAITLGIITGNQLQSQAALAIGLGVTAGVLAGLGVGMVMLLYGFREKYVRVEDLIDLLEVEGGSPGQSTPKKKAMPRTLPTSSVDEDDDEAEPTISVRRQRDFSAVGWNEPPEGFDE